MELNDNARNAADRFIEKFEEDAEGHRIEAMAQLAAIRKLCSEGLLLDEMPAGAEIAKLAGKYQSAEVQWRTCEREAQAIRAILEEQA